MVTGLETAAEIFDGYDRIRGVRGSRVESIECRQSSGKRYRGMSAR